MNTVKVLVFPCGSEIGLELHRSLKGIRFVEVHGASSVRDHGAFVYANYHEGMPYLNDPSFDEEFVSFVQEHGFDVVFPALDDAIVKLVDLADKLPCTVIAASKQTADICRNKEATYQVLSDCWFNPRTYRDASSVDAYPVLLKPSVGQGSAGVKRIDTPEELEFELATRSDKQVICEFLPGEEYTIDCFTDRHGEVRFASQRVRNRTKAGISVNSYLTQPSDEVRGIAEQISKRLGLRGMWFFQLKLNAQGEYRLLEVAPRVAGTMCLSRAIGVNLPLLAIFDALGYDVDVMPQFDACEVDRALSNAYALECAYDAVYIDFDDTIVRDGQVVLPTVQFLYQCVNRGIPVHLLSRHERDIHESLAAARLSEDLFDSIVIIRPDQKKSACIDASLNPVFIDDSFAERRDVHRTLGIKVFGLDNLDALIDRRE